MIGSLIQSLYVMGSFVCIVVPRILSKFHQRGNAKREEFRMPSNGGFRFSTIASSASPLLRVKGLENKKSNLSSSV